MEKESVDIVVADNLTDNERALFDIRLSKMKTKEEVIEFANEEVNRWFDGFDDSDSWIENSQENIKIVKEIIILQWEIYREIEKQRGV